MARRSPARVVLLAGPSGSGKTRLTHQLGTPVVRLDDFYRDEDDPGLPRRFGIVDWDDPASWDVEAACRALTDLCEHSAADVPVYSIPRSRRTGTRRQTIPEDAPLVVAEGLFAAELIDGLRRAGLLADAIVIHRPPLMNFAFRLWRDLRQGRKAPHTLIRRGLGLLAGERAMMRRWTSGGMRPLSVTRAHRDVRATAAALERRAALTPDVLTVAAICFVADRGEGPELLTVRKHGTHSFMLPGGKIEPGETPAQCACREVGEELGVHIRPDDLAPLGHFEAAAANEADTIVRSSVFLAPAGWLGPDADRFGVDAEIEESLWCPISAPQTHVAFAPLTQIHVLPLLRARQAEDEAA